MSRTISLLAMGGTISTRPRDGRSVPGRSAAEIAGEVPVPTGVDLRLRDVATVSSRNITPTAMWELAQAVRDEIDHGADGVVVTHGTDTLEETAYALAMLLPTAVPVVLTGAMRTPQAPGSDGPGNLAAACAAAARPELTGYGPVVVHQDEIHAARWVTKLYSSRIAAFASPACGPVGLVTEGRPTLLLGPPHGTDRLPATAPPTAEVTLLWVVAGIAPALVTATVAAADGLVVAGTGGGHTPAAVADALAALAGSGFPVVLSTRCVGGRVLTDTYGGPGSETQLLRAGLRSAGALPAVKARLRLLFGLSAGLTAADLFDQDGDRR